MPTVDAAVVQALVAGDMAAPFDHLGLHPLRGPGEPGRVVRCFVPWAARIRLILGEQRLGLDPEGETGYFEIVLPEEGGWPEYRLELTDRAGNRYEVEDPYRFGPVLSDEQLASFAEGRELRAHRTLGARPLRHQGVDGCLFAVWAPFARCVNLRGDFNGWDARCHPMRPRGASGIWELFLPSVGEGALYKFEIPTNYRGLRQEKTDPYGFAMERRPQTASRVVELGRYEWGDGAWMRQRAQRRFVDEPMSIYEVHLGSWRRNEPGPDLDRDPGFLSYRELAEQLIPYAAELGYTHLELLPITEHPYDRSWGYQSLGYFAPTARFGAPDDFRYFVDRAHQAGLGVILDWVPAHFPRDGHGLSFFDGTHLYEHEDPRQGSHPDWGTLIYNYGRPQVQTFLLSSALFWLEEYHLDGLRVDAVSSMLYLDYGREKGDWVPNRFGGRENLEAIDFLRRFNEVVHGEHPDVITFAEESTAWPLVSAPTYDGGLGFDLKWNMGWMNDTLEYMKADPLFRKNMHHKLTFSLIYAFSENFLLPFSHDEVVHMKGSLLSRMPGFDPDRFASLRLLLAYMHAHPGKKLLFMGGEFGQWSEWNDEGQLDWGALAYPGHRGLKELTGELNRLHREVGALHELDFSWQGFEWVDCQDAASSVLSLLRFARDRREFALAVGNFTPVPREHYRVGVPEPGRYRLLLNTDEERWGGRGRDVHAEIEAVAENWQGRPYALDLSLPPLSMLIYEPLRG